MSQHAEKSIAHANSAVRAVGLGASAGGLAVLEQFLAHVPPSSGLAYVVVQHLDPTQKAMLVELLQRATDMPVLEATDTMRIEPDVVYVIPPNKEMSLAGGLLHLAEPVQPRGMRLPIDLFFSSLARDQGDRSIGVVLSGMGSDGSLGLQAIKSQGGLTLAQAPESAQFDSMPKSAIATGCVDITGPVSDLPDRILRFIKSKHGDSPGNDDEAGDGQQAIGSILGLLKERSKHDLSDYKPSTLRRRIQRRLGVHGLTNHEAYEQFARDNPQELDLLFKEMLIGVTSFFRDPVVWQELRDTVMPALVARSPQGTRLRAWVVGCSTGEEAYSLAMVFKELLGELDDPESRSLQIFASDLSADAINVARKGHYPQRITGEMDPVRLGRFFTAQGSGFLINSDIREMVLFAQHDVILDPPFTKLDLLSCRNLMIYFNAELQSRLMPLFSYSLRPGGALLLGGSETIGKFHALFTPASQKSRLYWRSEYPVNAGSVYFPTSPRRVMTRHPQEFNVSPSTVLSANLQTHAEQALLQEFSPAAVLVNAQGDIVFINGSVGKYLEPASGKANWNIHVMTRPTIRTQIAAALRQALQDKGSVEVRGLRLSEEPIQTSLDVTVKLMHEPHSLAGLVMVVFRDVVAPVPAKRRRKPADGAVDPQLVEELQRCKDEILALRQEMGASAEELQSANEELQSTNEELQSANEELTTSKEESQSMNEELQTLNHELQTKLDDLALAQSDMQNLLNSTDIATLFLDSALNVRRYTEQITRIIHLREGDIGRPLTDLASTLNYPGLNEDAKQTLKTLTLTEKEITTTDGLWFLVRIKPYRTLANMIHGVVITLIDITTAKKLEARLRKG
ncbi:MAG: chemotaxis protein CheB [Hydrogenophaga sp.]|uniref:chemotaxis protein CheB n=1 Tax=Hydrogenophaga sp. TaxID=1904254 RepID=UPI002730DCA8|nr:chemotaxis protein CheB [Hydrogenophaga sp.]MDP1780421.1 chemotaxis protein CheB [Hydrogenophaga sp.]MDP2249526.1 chemotaxis protein CheB [Hydrogenophaga sp.]MDZ4128057.1 chemotaxis protein CheB [Hydrogenophaga sp.]